MAQRLRKRLRIDDQGKQICLREHSGNLLNDSFSSSITHKPVVHDRNTKLSKSKWHCLRSRRDGRRKRIETGQRHLASDRPPEIRSRKRSLALRGFSLAIISRWALFRARSTSSGTLRILRIPRRQKRGSRKSGSLVLNR